MTLVLLHAPLAVTAMSVEHDDAAPFEDGTVRVRGILASEDRRRLELTHFDTGELIDGWAVWMPKEAGDDS